MSTTPQNLYLLPPPGIGYPYGPVWYDGNTAPEPWHTPQLIGVQLQPAAQQPPKDPADGTIELKVPFCCDGVISKMIKKLYELDGVGSVDCDRVNNKVIVKGSVKREKVLKQVKTIKQLQRTEFFETKKSKS